MITYGVAKQILAKYKGYAGTCPNNDPSLDLFIKSVFEYLLINGTYGNERTFVFNAENGCFTLPKELETPLKIRIDCEIGSVWNRWFEYHSGNRLDNNCLDSKSLLDMPGYFPTVYDGPTNGFNVGITAFCDEEDVECTVKGIDPAGVEIFTFDRGHQIVGEVLRPVKGKTVTTTVKFGRVTEVVFNKRRKGYLEILWVQDDGSRRGFLGRYDPFELIPSYRRVKILANNHHKCSKITVLGRIRLKEFYADDDVVPFENILIIQTAGQMVNSMYNTDLQAVLARQQFVQGLIDKEGQYKTPDDVGQPVEMFYPLSGGAIKNMGRRFNFGAIKRRFAFGRSK